MRYFFPFLLLIVICGCNQILLINQNSINTTNRNKISEPKILNISSTTHTKTVENFSGIIEDGYYLYSSPFELHFGDIFYVNFTAKPQNAVNSGVILNLRYPASLADKITDEVQNGTYYFFVTQTMAEGNYSYFFYNPGLFTGGDPINVTGQFVKIANSLPSLNVTSTMYIQQNFNFTQWNPLDTDADQLTYSINYLNYSSNLGLSASKLIQNTSNIEDINTAINTKISDGKYQFNIVINDTFSALNKDFTTMSSFTFIVYVDRANPVFIEKPQDYVLSNNSSFQLNWTLNDANPTTFQVFVNGTLKLSDAWFSGVPITMQISDLGYLEPGKYNFTIIAFDIMNNTAIYTNFITIESNSSSSNNQGNTPGFEIFSLLALPAIIILRKIKKSK